MRSFSAFTAVRTSSSVTFMPLVRETETSVILSEGFSNRRDVIVVAVLPNTSESTSSSLMLETARQF